jgi:hypothetical protein
VRNVASPCERVIEAARQEPLNISAALNIFRSDDVRWHVSTTPNVRAKLPVEAGAVSLVRDDAPSAADQAYSACRSGSA